MRVLAFFVLNEIFWTSFRSLCVRLCVLSSSPRCSCPIAVCIPTCSGWLLQQYIGQFLTPLASPTPAPPTPYGDGLVDDYSHTLGSGAMTSCADFASYQRYSQIPVRTMAKRRRPQRVSEAPSATASPIGTRACGRSSVLVCGGMCARL